MYVSDTTGATVAPPRLHHEPSLEQDSASELVRLLFYLVLRVEGPSIILVLSFSELYSYCLDPYGRLKDPPSTLRTYRCRLENFCMIAHRLETNPIACFASPST